VEQFAVDASSSQPRLLLALQAVLSVLDDVQGATFTGTLPGQTVVEALGVEAREALRSVSQALNEMAAQQCDVDPITLQPRAGSVDVFCAGVLQMLDPRVRVDADDAIDTSALNASPQDFLWSRLWSASLVALATASWSGANNELPYSLGDLAHEAVVEMGALEWDPEGNKPYEYAKMCLLCGQPEAAVAHLAERGSVGNPTSALEDAVHLAVAAHHNGLLRTVSPLAVREQPQTGGLLLHAVAVRGNNPAVGTQLYASDDMFFEHGAFALDFTTLLSKFRSARLRQDPSRAAQYFCILGSVGCATAAGAPQFSESQDRNQMLFELLNASHEYDSLIGNVSSDLTPHCNGTLDLVVSNAVYTQLQPADLYRITERAALRAADEGRWLHAYRCQLRACNAAAALSILTTQISNSLLQPDSAERTVWRRYALQFRSSSLGSFPDIAEQAISQGDSDSMARLRASAQPLDGFRYSDCVQVLRKLLAVLDATDAALQSQHSEAIAILDSQHLLPTGSSGDQFWQSVVPTAGSTGSSMGHPALQQAIFAVLQLAAGCFVAQFQAGRSVAGSGTGAARIRVRAAALHSTDSRIACPLSGAQVDELRRLVLPLTQ
jgi:hypothetical protein